VLPHDHASPDGKGEYSMNTPYKENYPIIIFRIFIGLMICLILNFESYPASAQGDLTLPKIDGPVPVGEAPGIYQPPRTPESNKAYAIEEFFISGKALGRDYVTTLNVLRPIHPGANLRTAIVEPTHPGNIWPVRSTTSDYLMNAGHISVTVNSSALVVERLVKPYHPKRYSPLSVPNLPGIENEILAQVGAMLKHGGLPDVKVGKLILAGYSNTGGKVREYILAKHNQTRLTGNKPIYDGYFPGQTAVGALPKPIPDMDVPVIELQGEREIIATFKRNPGGLTYRRPDGQNYRLYEVPGMSHMDTSDPEMLPFSPSQCNVTHPSSFPLKHFWQNALKNLIVWVETGKPAPRAERIQLTEDGMTIKRDNHGNAIGGVPAPQIQIPIASYYTVSEGNEKYPNARCDMIGYQVSFSKEKLIDLYGSFDNYAAKFNQRLNELVRDGWYLETDAAKLRSNLDKLKDLFQAK